MGKSIIIFDTPTKCNDCPLKIYYPDIDSFVCEVGRSIGKKWGRVDPYFKPEWCCLKEVPNKLSWYTDLDRYEKGYVDGWNDAINEITEDD